jgi:predicted MFS family arabinose efflux permease
MKTLQFAIMIAAVLSGVRVSNATNDGTYFYLGVGIAIVAAVWMYLSRKNRQPAKSTS